MLKLYASTWEYSDLDLDLELELIIRIEGCIADKKVILVKDGPTRRLSIAYKF